MINNNIQESYCSFEVSKLLKEKGFLNEQKWYYNESNPDDIIAGHNISDLGYCLRPTHALAIEWIRVNFGIWIYSDLRWRNIGWYYDIIDLNKMEKLFNKSGYNSPQEATEAAIKHTLKNLI